MWAKHSVMRNAPRDRHRYRDDGCIPGARVIPHARALQRGRKNKFVAGGEGFSEALEKCHEVAQKAQPQAESGVFRLMRRELNLPLASEFEGCEQLTLANTPLAMASLLGRCWRNPSYERNPIEGGARRIGPRRTLRFEEN
jgi:hypothetical protein